jgi:archaeal flagellar protein FlaJ
MKKTGIIDAGIILLGVSLVVVSYFVWGVESKFYLAVLLGLILSSSPIIFRLIRAQIVLKEKESKFLEFSRDLAENVKSGTPVTQSIINLRSKDYGALSPNIEKLVNQIKLSIGLGQSLGVFAKDTKSSMIKRAVELISEAEKAGGEVEKIIESVSRSVNQIEVLKKERQATISTLTVQGYLIFIIFIGIMIVLEYMILPLVGNIPGVEGVGLNINPVNVDSLSTPLLIIVITQALFAGLVIGKLAYGKIKYGVRHSFILLLITLLITFGTKVFLG